MITETDITPKIQICRDKKVKLIRYWEDVTRLGMWEDVIITDRIPRCITRELTTKQVREIEQAFK